MEHPDWLTKEYLEQRFKTDAKPAALADYGAINVELKALYTPRYSACHAGFALDWEYKWSATCHKYLSERVRKAVPGNYRSLGIDWMTWFIGPTSPWRDVAERLIIRDPEWCWDYGLVLGPTDDLPGNLVYGFMIASRFLTEKPEYVENWAALRAEGVHPALAYWLSHVAHAKQHVRMGHRAVHVGSINETYVTNLISGVQVSPSDPYCRNGVDNLWGDSIAELSTIYSVYAHGNYPGTYIRQLAEQYPEHFTDINTTNTFYNYAPNGEKGRFPKTLEDLAAVGLKEQERLGLV